MTPSSAAFAPLMLFSPLVSSSISQAIGLPKTTSIRKPATTLVNSGMTSTGIRPRAHAGTFRPASQCAITPASTPPRMAPMKPVCGVPSCRTSLARPPITKPGAMPGRSAMA